METVTIWACRWSIGYGWKWIAQRRCSLDDSQNWLAVFRKDEPTVSFKAQKTKPRN